MELESVYIGAIDLHEGRVDISDPCHNSDVWCRINNLEIKPGMYSCFALVGTDPSWGTRTWGCRIAINNEDDLTIIKSKIEADEWEVIGEVGVDAGLAGFFASPKPDFNDDNWSELCNQMDFDSYGYLGENFNMPEDIKGFWTPTGYGDGGYDVRVIRDNNTQIIALEIAFL